MEQSDIKSSIDHNNINENLARSKGILLNCGGMGRNTSQLLTENIIVVLG